MVSVEISDAASETGALLCELLEERDVYDETRAEATVCYGVARGRYKHALNAKCMSNKVKRMVAMAKAGVRLVPWFYGKDIDTGMLKNYTFPMLARKITGHGGTDIVPVFEPKEVAWRMAAGWDWFSSYIPTATEYRVWIYRGEHLDTYEKVMKRPGDYKYIGRNFRNGFDFGHSTEHKDATRQAALAVHALELDFAAIDMLRGEDGKIYVLEANTAPGVIRSGAQSTLEKLADRITDWDLSDWPEWDCCR